MAQMAGEGAGPTFVLMDRDAAGRTLAGDGRAFEEIVCRYGRPIFAHLFRMTGRREDAEDLAQETFLRALRSLRQYDPSKPLKPWLYRIATNAALTHLRRTKARVVSIEDLEIEDECAESPAERIDGEAVRDRLARAIASLPAEAAALFNLRYAEEMSIEQIAETLGRRPGAVTVALHRLRLKLRAMIAGGDGHELR